MLVSDTSFFLSMLNLVSNNNNNLIALRVMCASWMRHQWGETAQPWVRPDCVLLAFLLFFIEVIPIFPSLASHEPCMEHIRPPWPPALPLHSCCPNRTVRGSGIIGNTWAWSLVHTLLSWLCVGCPLGTGHIQAQTNEWHAAQTCKCGGTTENHIVH